MLIPQASFAEVSVPAHEYVGYFDSNEIYTVVGNVKNDMDYAIVPTISVSVIDVTDEFSKTVQHTSISSGNEIPFKIKFPEVLGNFPMLMPAEIAFEKTTPEVFTIDVIYDQTLIVHEDGHLTGRVINSGTETVSDFKIFAVIHGFDNETLDIGQNILPLTEMMPGEIREFTMYPDPKFMSKVWYYSCFAVGQDSVIVLNVPRNDDAFKIRYDSSILLSYPEFNSEGTSLSFSLIQGWSFDNYINLEFSKHSENESFQVFLNDEHVDSIQSVDDVGNWHVAFLVEPQSEGILTISGFDPEGKSLDEISIPDWIRNDANLWLSNNISDSEFLEDLDYLFDKQIISAPELDVSVELQRHIPSWIKISTSWWYEEIISDTEFLNLIENLVTRKIITI
ncbi:MAG: peptidase [Nitrosopumilus sp.]|nr:MAG: peptidase [Nitrosopumilus sp.]